MIAFALSLLPRAALADELVQGINEIVGPYQANVDFQVPIIAQLNLTQADVASALGVQVMPGDDWDFLSRSPCRMLFRSSFAAIKGSRCRRTIAEHEASRICSR
jgi:hypothetical protein